MKWTALVQQYFPDADESLAGFLLWNETAFPLCSPDHARLQLAQHKCTMEFLCGGPYLTGQQELDRFAETDSAEEEVPMRE